MENKKEMNREELNHVSGGDGYIVDLENGDYEYWFMCSYCLDYKELILRGNSHKYPPTHIEGTFVCPKCGWKRKYVFNCGW